MNDDLEGLDGDSAAVLWLLLVMATVAAVPVAVAVLWLIEG